MFKIGFSLKNRDFLNLYDKARKNQYLPYNVLKKNQEEKLKDLIFFSYHNVPYYQKLFKRIKLYPEDIQKIEDLQKIPILTKDILRRNPKDFLPKNLNKQKYASASTGGSTGNPFNYRISNEDRLLDAVLFYAYSTECANYELGDKIAMLAGSRLLPSKKAEFIKKFKEMMLNIKNFSSFDMSNDYLNKMINELEKFKPEYLRGYASSIYLFAKYIESENKKINFKLKGIFTTAEVLFDYQRSLIEEVFKTKVFNQYSLNDGGASAFECEEHNGMHVDMLRSITEIVDEHGNQLGANREGHILATSLHNYAMPFIRYDTNDLGILSNIKCGCGRDLPLLKKIIGRESDFICTPNGNRIHGEFFSIYFVNLIMVI